VNNVSASFNTTTAQMTEMSQRKKQVWSEGVGKKGNYVRRKKNACARNALEDISLENFR